MPIISPSLVADYHVTGVLVSGSSVYQWNDSHLDTNNDGLGPHNLAQPTVARRPYLNTDFQGNNCVAFPWGRLAGNDPKNYLVLPSPSSITGIVSTNYSVYIVADYLEDVETVSVMLSMISGGTSLSMGINNTTLVPPCLFTANSVSTVYPPINKSVYSFIGRSTQNLFAINDRMVSAAANTFNRVSGLLVGRHAGSDTLFYHGNIYRILLYSSGHTSGEASLNISQLISEYNITTGFSENIVCRGDSLTLGQGPTGFSSYPYQLYTKIPNKRIYSIGVGGQAVSSMTTQLNQRVHPLRDGSNKNTLFLFGGINDIVTQGDSVEQTYTDITGFCRNTVQSGWDTRVLTLIDYIGTTYDGTITGVNNLIRTGIGLSTGYYSGIADVGVPTEPRLSNSANATYYDSDQIHLTQAGYAVIANTIYSLFYSGSSPIFNRSSPPSTFFGVGNPKPMININNGMFTTYSF